MFVCCCSIPHPQGRDKSLAVLAGDAELAHAVEMAVRQRLAVGAAWWLCRGGGREILTRGVGRGEQGTCKAGGLAPQARRAVAPAQRRNARREGGKFSEA